jgi:hypothetical protein
MTTVAGVPPFHAGGTRAEQSDSVIFEYHARTGVIRTFMGRKGTSAFHLEPNLPEGKLQGQVWE